MGYGMNSAMNRNSTGGNTSTASTGAFREKRPHGYQMGALQQFNPEQMQLFQQLFSNVGPESYLARLGAGDESLFNQMEAPAMRQFSGLQGNIASRFSGMGMGSRNSSGFQNTMNQASSDFAQDLASRRQGLQRQAIMDLMGLSHTLLGERPSERYLMPKKQKPDWGNLVGKFGGMIPGALTSLATGGNPASGAAGGIEGFASAFGGNMRGGF